jgi:hypothetical protein
VEEKAWKRQHPGSPSTTAPAKVRVQVSPSREGKSEKQKEEERARKIGQHEKSASSTDQKGAIPGESEKHQKGAK